MNRRISSRQSHLETHGVSIELIDDTRGAVEAAPAPRTSVRRSGKAPVRFSVAPPEPEGPGLVGLGLALAVTLGAAVFGLLAMNPRPVSQRGPAPVAAAPGTVAEFEETAPELPPPSEAELAALETDTPGAMGDALRTLAQRGVTPQGLYAVDAAARRTTDAELLRRITCYRVRGGAPLEEAFSALPATPVADAEWSGDGTACLLEAIAARASEMPERSVQVLSDRALIQDSDAIVAGLAQLDPEQLPGPVVAALGGVDHQTRRAAIRIAIALGAAARWPELVHSWLEDPDQVIRLHTNAELLRQPDEDSQWLAAWATAADAADEELSRRAVEQIARGDGFDRFLAAIAADASAPADARAHAADLVGRHGGADACRVVRGIPSTEPALAPALAEALARIDQRFGSSITLLASR
jgi:hypothetical protein